MTLEVLPTRTAGAAENMAVDFLLLQRYPRATPRFRHYGWRRPAFTFGYSQKIAFVREQLAALGNEGGDGGEAAGGGEAGEVGRHFDLCRRPTGGGIVDHREDWTYMLVIPRGHELEELRATQSYQLVHEALAAALCAQGVDAITKPAIEGTEDGATGDAGPSEAATAGVASAAGAGVCFQRAEVYDVVHAHTGEKIAGAAQKRNKHGLLFQGSVWRPAVAGGAGDVGDARKGGSDGGIDWDRFEADFIAGLAEALGVPAEPTPWPELNEDEVSGLTEQYSSTEWVEYR